MVMNRREFLEVTSAAGAGLLAGTGTKAPAAVPQPEKAEYKYRLAFDVWINDVRNEAMPLENWPYGVLDDKTVDSIIKALDVQGGAGYNFIDPIGFWTTYAWPVDFKKLVDRDRDRRVNQILKAAHERKIKVTTFPCG